MDGGVASEVRQGTLRTASGRALPLERTVVRATIGDALAEVVVEQRFRNDTVEPIEAVYSFPMPEDAAVHSLSFRIDDRLVVGRVKERAEARRDYERALSEGRAATLLEEDAPDLLTLAVANIKPGATIVVELAYQELVAYDDGQHRFTFPMVAPEVYLAGPSDGPRRPSGARPRDVEIEVAIDVDAAASGLRCRSHDVVLSKDPKRGTRVALSAEAHLPNRDFVLTWKAGDSGVRPTLRLHRREGEPGTFLLSLMPSTDGAPASLGGANEMRPLVCGNCGAALKDPRAIVNVPGIGPVFPCNYCGAVLAPGMSTITRASRPRDVVLLVDRSCSVRPVFDELRRAVMTLLGALGPSDAVQVLGFDHELAEFEPGGRWALLSPELLRQVDQFLANLAPRGGSDLEAAIERAGRAASRDGRTKLVVLVSDGAVGNGGRLARRVPELLGAGTRLHVLGVGPNVDARLCRRLAAATGGSCEVLAVDPSTGEARRDREAPEEVVRFARRVAQAGPVLTDLRLHWEGAAPSLVLPDPLPDLYSHQPLRLVGRFDGHGASKLVLTGLTAEGVAFRQELERELPTATEDLPGLSRLWARRRVTALHARASADPKEAAAISREGTWLSVEHSIVGPYTSLVAEDVEVSVESIPHAAGQLEIVGGVNRGLTFDVVAGVTRIGRSGYGADFTVHDAAASRAHCEVYATREGFSVRDIGSVNGTFVDGTRTKDSPLAPGSNIRIGSTTLVFRVSGERRFDWLPTRRPDRPYDPALFDARKATPPELVVERPRGASYGSPAHGGICPRCSAPNLPTDRLCAVCASPLDGAPGYSAMGPPPGYGAMGGGFAPSPSVTKEPPRYGGLPPAPASLVASAPLPAFAPPPAMAAAPPGFGAPPPGMGAPPPLGFSPPRFGAPSPTAAPAAFGPPMAASDARYEPDPFGATSFPTGGAYAPAPSAIAPSPPARMTAAAPPASMPHVPAPVSVGRAHHEVGSAFASPGRAPARPIHLDREPYDPAELAWLRSAMTGALDLVFLVDETGSMGPYIAEVQTQLQSLVDLIAAEPLSTGLRIAVVSYRDHPPEEMSFVTRVFGFNAELAHVRAHIDKLHARGGGDGPESVTDGLVEVVRLDWRASAAKAVVWFGDAPPHGVEPSGDGFPGGCPCGKHWFAEAENLREMGIPIFAVGCLPALRQYVGAEAVFRKVGEATRGRYLPLVHAERLVPLIVGSALAALDAQRIDAHVRHAVADAVDDLRATTEVERARWLMERLALRAVRPRDLCFDERSGAGSLAFRDLTHADVHASLGRLRAERAIPF